MPCLAEMKGLVSTALTLTIWSIVREKLQVWTWTNIHSQVRNAISQNWWVISWVNFDDPCRKLSQNWGGGGCSFTNGMFFHDTVIPNCNCTAINWPVLCGHARFLWKFLLPNAINHDCATPLVHWTHPQTNFWSPASPLKWVIGDRSVVRIDTTARSIPVGRSFWDGIRSCFFTWSSVYTCSDSKQQF